MRDDALLLISEVLSRDGWTNAIYLRRVWTAPLQWSAAPADRPDFRMNWTSWRLNVEYWLMEDMAQGTSPAGRTFEPPQELIALRNGGLPTRGLRMFVDTANPRENRQWSDCHLRYAAFMAE
jgi:hypothetical protein